MISNIIYKFCNYIYRGFNKVFITPGKKDSFGSCGKNVKISYGLDIRGNKNIYIGNNCQIGAQCLFWTTRAKIIIEDSVLIGPKITIITGDHRTYVIGKHVIDVGDEEKLPEQDADVTIKQGVWISSNVTILKGVTIGEGAIIAAGAVVVNDVEPYSIYGGVPAKKLKDRFTDEELKLHKLLMEKASLVYDDCRTDNI